MCGLMLRSIVVNMLQYYIVYGSEGGGGGGWKNTFMDVDGREIGMLRGKWKETLTKNVEGSGVREKITKMEHT